MRIVTAGSFASVKMKFCEILQNFSNKFKILHFKSYGIGFHSIIFELCSFNYNNQRQKFFCHLMFNLKRRQVDSEEEEGECEEEYSNNASIYWNWEENKYFATKYRSERIQVFTDVLSEILQQEEIFGEMEIPKEVLIDALQDYEENNQFIKYAEELTLVTNQSKMFTVYMRKILLFCSFCKLPCGKESFVFCDCANCIYGQTLKKVCCWNCKHMFVQWHCPSIVENFDAILSGCIDLEYKIKSSKEYHFAPFLQCQFECSICKSNFPYCKIFVCSGNTTLCSNCIHVEDYPELFAPLVHSGGCQFCNGPGDYRCRNSSCMISNGNVCDECCWTNSCCLCGESFQHIRDFLCAKRKQLLWQCVHCPGKSLKPIQDLLWIQDHKPEAVCESFDIPISGHRYQTLRLHFKLLKKLQELKGLLKAKYDKAVIKDVVYYFAFLSLHNMDRRTIDHLHLHQIHQRLRDLPLRFLRYCRYHHQSRNVLLRSFDLSNHRQFHQLHLHKDHLVRFLNDTIGCFHRCHLFILCIMNDSLSFSTKMRSSTSMIVVASISFL